MISKTLIILFFLLTTSCHVMGSEIGAVVGKAVNGDWEQKAIVNIELGSDVAFLGIANPGLYLNTAAVFVSPRATGPSLSPNHERFDATIGMTFDIWGAILGFNTGASYWWDGNSSGIPGDTIDWTNEASLVWQF